MAIEKLYELHDDGDFDLVVVDTPPTRNALDFLDAPRSADALPRPSPLPPADDADRAGRSRAVNVAAQAFLRTLAKVVGARGDRRCDHVLPSLRRDGQGLPRTGRRGGSVAHRPVHCVCARRVPRRDTVEEARFVAERLRDSGRSVPAVIINRMTPRFGAAPEAVTPSPLTRNLDELTTLADTEEAQLAPLFDVVGETVVVRVPLLADDVHDLESLDRVRSFIFAGVR